MIPSQRIRPALVASLKHLSASLAVALLCAALVFGLWYPYPYSELVGGRELFLIMISVDVVCGPLLTLVVFNPRKPRRELIRDIGIVVCLQLAALAYGLSTTIQARPVFLAFEADLFRVVGVPDIDVEDLPNAPGDLRELSFSGPRVIGVRLAKSSDPDYVQSIKSSIEGFHPAFRPHRWVGYTQQRQEVLAKARPLMLLRQKHPAQQQLIDETVQKSLMSEQQLGYLPLTAKMHTDWVVIVGLSDAQPKAFLPLDGW